MTRDDEERDDWDPGINDRFAEDLANAPREKAREKLVEKLTKRIVAERLCACEHLKTGTKHRYHGRHLKGCPLGEVPEEALKQMLKPVAEEIAELELRNAELHAKAASVEGRDQVYVPCNSNALQFVVPTDQSFADSWDDATEVIARCMGARIVPQHKWRDTSTNMARFDLSHTHDPLQEPLARPVMEKNPDFGKKGHASEEKFERVDVRHENRDHITFYAVFPSERHAKDFIGVIRELRQLLEALYDAGKGYGKSLLTQLAKGEISVDTFNVRAEEFQGERKGARKK
jgi:hypothetical protein